MSLRIKFGNFLYKNAFVIYKPLYTLFKDKQDAFEIELLEKYIHKGDVVVDIGANIGYYARILSTLAGPKGSVHCFEPDLINFGHLKKYTSNLSNIILNNKAVGPRTEFLKIYTSKNLNVDHRTYKPEDYDKEIEIEAISLDDYFENSARIDFIKMDIQGFEMQAIRGMQRVLEDNKKIRIISEFWPYGLRKAGNSVSEYFDFLNSEGFICYLLEKRSLQKLSSEKVKTLEHLGEEHYFNIFASRSDV
jgi:FkbM family methyltransferase